MRTRPRGGLAISAPLLAALSPMMSPAPARAAEPAPAIPVVYVDDRAPRKLAERPLYARPWLWWVVGSASAVSTALAVGLIVGLGPKPVDIPAPYPNPVPLPLGLRLSWGAR